MRKVLPWVTLACIGAIFIAFIISQSNHSSIAEQWDIRQSELLINEGKIVFEIEDRQPKALQASTFSVSYSNQAANEQEKPLLLPHAGEIVVSLEMLTMDCGVVSFKLQPNEHGVYVGEGIPVMPGKWLATAALPQSLTNVTDELQTISFVFDVN